MLTINVPAALKNEFATVEAIWMSGAETRRTDALVLAWVKHEKQLRRLFCFLVFQHPKITEASIHRVIADLAENRRLNPEVFLRGIKDLGVAAVPTIMSADYERLWPAMQKIKKNRNKLAHGQITGQKIRSVELERYVRTVVEWMSCLGEAAKRVYGYDGVQRNTFRQAKTVAQRGTSYPFVDARTFGSWLTALSR